MKFFLYLQKVRSRALRHRTRPIDLAKRLHEELCEYGFDYPLAIFSTIGYSYVENAQMNERIEKFGKGTAQYICDAIQEYVGWL